jgi:hypothetical protein
LIVVTDERDRIEDDAAKPPVAELEDVPPEEWTYWNAQAGWGCMVIVALVLAMLLPPLLMTMMDDTQAKLIGFGVSGGLALLSFIMIYTLTNRKRAERRAALRQAVAERRQPPGPALDDSVS